MELIGMMGSPYVRRVAISMRLMGINHRHRQLSVFRDLEEFRYINPVVKAPTLLCDDGSMIMESSLILDYINSFGGSDRSLIPSDNIQYKKTLSLIGLGLVVCEKAVQIEYERNRPIEHQYQPWFQRLKDQMHSAMKFLDAEAANADPWLASDYISQADVTVAVAWRFTQFRVSDLIDISSYAALSAFSDRLERLPEFIATPLK
ncbi:glutathione S-transferase [Methylobacterium indicum]|uniref:Glutathione S-transferase n=1 Tax=Methylobacterium indicum TaxID=1775910 RepID=A0A8H8X0V0_9HYPH|nr:glutathione S-transferase [Methylobacterium indicum]BCM87639.1 glutathione S-transferase [Methylobacterium indicum]